MRLDLPKLSLVILIGASGCGKSTFARRHFKPTEILSSDHYRGVVSDDETDQSASKDAFEILHYIAAKRLAAGRLTVIDATNVRPEDRQQLIEIARQYHVFPIAIAFNLPEQLCHERNAQRPDRHFGPHVVKRHTQALRRSLKGLYKEGFHRTYVLDSLDRIESVEIDRQPLWNNRHQEHGPFDIIGDVHGCCDELEQLLDQLGYHKQSSADFYVTALGEDLPPRDTYRHPDGRRAIFLGDLVDRGPRIIDTIDLVTNMIAAGQAFCVVGNHDDKLLRYLQGKNVKIAHGLECSIAQIEALDPAIKAEKTIEIRGFLESLVSHYVLDDGKLVVAHAGLKQELQGRGAKAVRAFAMYGETTGEIDEFGLPVRYNWAAEYRGQAMVAYGHTPVPASVWLNETIDLDTGCVFGGKLTALRYPERELVSVAAAKVYCEPIRPLGSDTTKLSAQQQVDDVLDLDDVLGKRRIETRLHPQMITIRAENASAALAAMSRFAIDPRWLIYLPPTMSPVATSSVPGYLEYPTEALSFYQAQGVSQVICEEKHMGSRAIAIVCRSAAVAEQRFGVTSNAIGICYTRTGRKFFNDDNLAAAFIDRLHQALSRSNFWQELDTDWVCLDCELMPWSAKAQELIRQQYAPVGVAARVTLAKSIELLDAARARGVDVGNDVEKYRERHRLAEDYTAAYRRYCWTVNSLADLKLAPFHIVATEGNVHTDKTHLWHLQQIAKICHADSQLLLATNHRVVDLNDTGECERAVDWWLELTQQGGEGMVVKPLDFIVTGGKGVLQPAVKCRGREYLRMIYGAEYTLPQHLDRLRQRGLSLKRSLASREFALGIEALQRFVDREPLRRVHECVFAILALESQPIDPRL